MSLQLHRPDGKGGLEPREVTDENWHNQLRSPRWGASLKGGRPPKLANPEMNPTSTARSIGFWVALGLITFIVIAGGLRVGVLPLPARRPDPAAVARTRRGNRTMPDAVRGPR